MEQSLINIKKNLEEFQSQLKDFKLEYIDNIESLKILSIATLMNELETPR